MRNAFMSTALIAALVIVLTAAGCGGSSSSSSSSGGGSKHAITASECRSIRSVFDDLESFLTGGGLDYTKNAATVDRLATTVEFPESVSDAYGKWQEAIDKIAVAMQDVGVKPNDTPLPDQMDKLNSTFDGSDSLNKAGATINTWVSNGCD